jgi:hypothetical protein
MKAAREQRMLLTTRMHSILDATEKVRTVDYVFPGQSAQPLSPMAG